MICIMYFISSFSKTFYYSKIFHRSINNGRVCLHFNPLTRTFINTCLQILFWLLIHNRRQKEKEKQLPIHVFLFLVSLYPDLHLHSNAPGLFRHIWLHPPFLILHLSFSETKMKVLSLILWNTSGLNKIRMFYLPVLRDYLYISFCQFLVYTQLKPSCGSYPIYLQTIQWNYTKLKICARIILPNIPV